MEVLEEKQNCFIQYIKPGDIFLSNVKELLLFFYSVIFRIFDECRTVLIPQITQMYLSSFLSLFTDIYTLISLTLKCNAQLFKDRAYSMQYSCNIYKRWLINFIFESQFQRYTNFEYINFL